MPLIVPASLANDTPPCSPLYLTEGDRALPALIRNLLSRSGLTQAEAAKRIGISRQNLVKFIAGKRPNASMKWIIRLVTVCGGRIMVELPPAARSIELHMDEVEVGAGGVSESRSVGHDLTSAPLHPEMGREWS